MKLAQYVFSFLQRQAVDMVFYLPGGGCMHLLDALCGQADMQHVSLLHEQAVAVACEAYANTRGTPCAALVTTGPGGTNTVTGVLAAYLDSSPCFYLSGQVKTEDLKSRYGVRGHGSQEADIVSIVSPITKYAAMVKTPDSIRYHLERAWQEMMSGRKGPVWLDIPLDVQAAEIDPDALEGFVALAETTEPPDVTALVAALNRANRPVMIAGNGMSGCKEEFGEVMRLLQIPVIPTWKAMDYVPNDHPLYAGRAGGMGDRPGNLTMQNADLILSLGCRLDFSITGFDRREWAPRAEKYVVEVDPAEVAKLRDVDGLYPIVADVGDVLRALLAQKDSIHMRDGTEWKKQVSVWKQRYPLSASRAGPSAQTQCTTYDFVAALNRQLPQDAYVAPCSSGTTAEIFFQAFTVKAGQTVRSNHGLGSMGFEIPTAIGMCLASGKKNVVCVAGDGGMQLNIQELAVVRGRNLPVKLFVINNRGYASIRNMQDNHFSGRHIGCDECSGLALPHLERLAAAYGLAYFKVDDPEMLEERVAAALRAEGPVMCEVVVEGTCLVSPRAASRVLPDGSMRSSPLVNQFPFLPDDEVEANWLT